MAPGCAATRVMWTAASAKQLRGSLLSECLNGNVVINFRGSEVQSNNMDLRARPVRSRLSRR